MAASQEISLERDDEDALAGLERALALVTASRVRVERSNTGIVTAHVSALIGAAVALAEHLAELMAIQTTEADEMASGWIAMLAACGTEFHLDLRSTEGTSAAEVHALADAARRWNQGIRIRDLILLDAIGTGRGIARGLDRRARFGWHFVPYDGSMPTIADEVELLFGRVPVRH